MQMAIHRLGDEDAVRFAAEELRRYARRMTGRPLRVRRASGYAPQRKGIWLGVSDRFGGCVPRRARPTGDAFADAVFVSAEDGHMILTGPNARSVLFAVYRYLEELGCRWLRPGPDGERIPRRRNPWRARVRLDEVPTTRHRVMVIEGNCSEQHVRNMIDYAAKRGFNAYFLQLRDSHVFFDGWYGAERHRRGRRVEELSDRHAHRHCLRAKSEIRKRGLVIHSMGHGWTHWPLGIRGHDWRPVRPKIPPSVRRYLAMINGKRRLFHGIPINTNLCTSNPRARAIMAEAVAAYAQANPDEVVHVWLADGSNNTCECARCRKARPSDFYVRILNEIDRRLSERGLPTRIVFLAYVDLLWAPGKERIRNPDRFLLMFAPITRSYTTAYLDQTGQPETVAPYRRNRLAFPKTPQGNLRMLARWRERFPGECVCFDYHLWLEPFRDPAHLRLLPVLFKDARGLGKLGMEGFLAVTTQRIAFPTGVLVHALGKALWSRKLGCRTTVNAYFADLFGTDGVKVRRYLEEVSRRFDPPLLRGEKTHEASRRAAVRSFARIPAVVEAFRGAIDKGCRSRDAVSAAAWKLLREHAWYAAALAELYGAAFGGDGERAARLYERMCRQLDRRLPRLQAVFDTRRARDQIAGVLRRADVPLPR